jgi:two-component system aerobic respiration control sensor histidine kinase ArcB
MATILYVEDNADNMLFVKRALEARGHQLLWAETGAQALTLAAHRLPDVVLLDLDLPDMDGCDLARALTHTLRHPRRRGPPILALTANVFSPTRRALAAGCGAQLLKPISLRDLSHHIEAALA